MNGLKQYLPIRKVPVQSKQYGHKKNIHTQQTFACSNSTMETLKICAKYLQS